MDKWNLVIDVAECHNCNNCVLSAKDEFVGNDFPGYSASHAAHGPAVIRIERQVRGSGHLSDAAYLPRLCNHCDDGPCLKAGADGAVRKREDGVVIFDPVKAKGRRDLVDTCPYGAVVWNEEQQLPQTWFFDAHLLDQGWTAPRAVTACPTRALQAVRASDAAMAERARRDGLRVLQPELGTRPRVHYRNLHRIDRLFIAGSVVATVDSRTECVEGAEASLSQGGRAVATTRTDAFGDFRFDSLTPGSGAFTLSVRHEQRGQTQTPVALSDLSITLPEVRLG
jgi:Fe-S-cluster-containing dehydrogenase component